MKEISSWNFLNHAAAIITIAGSAVLLAVVMVRRFLPQLSMLRIYLLFNVAAGIAGFALALVSPPGGLYARFWWIASAAEGLLMCIFAVEFAALLIPKKLFTLAWCSGLLTFVLLTGLKAVNHAGPWQALDFILTAAFAAGLVLAGIWFFDLGAWPAGYSSIAGGFLLYLAVTASAGILWDSTHWRQYNTVRILLPFAPLPMLSGVLGALLTSGKKSRGLSRSAAAG